MNQRVSTVSLLLALLSAPCVHAQTQRSGGGGEAQKFMQQYQQLAAEKTSLQAQVAQLKKDLDTAQTAGAALKKERDALKARAAGSAGAAAQLAQASASKESAEKNLEQAKQRTNELITRFKETVGTLKGVESDRDQLRKDNEALGVAFDKCAENNLQLYEISNTVLDRYDHVGLFTRVGTAEPFTKITRTRIENLVDEYRARAQDLRVKKGSP
jgi:DNA repair exonuclease SbcCD ATPase subunit